MTTVVNDSRGVGPEGSAVRVALWRAMHVQVDAAPHVLRDEIGIRLAAQPDERFGLPDMDPEFTKPFRASIVARARFIEDMVTDQATHGVSQYVILGAGLDTYAQRKPESTSALHIFEVDQPGPQTWKRQRLTALGYAISDTLHLVPVNFESGEAWWEKVAEAGFDAKKPAIVASAGVSMYLTKEATAATLREVAKLAPGSTLIMTFLMPLNLADPEVRSGVEKAEQGARESGTPFISFYTPEEMLALARECGFKEAVHVSTAVLAQSYFADRTDGLRPPNNAEEILVAMT